MAGSRLVGNLKVFLFQIKALLYKAITKVKTALHGHLNNRWNDLEMMSQFTHTGEIENFNSLMNKYCPKMYAYRYLTFN